MNDIFITIFHVLIIIRVKVEEKQGREYVIPRGSYGPKGVIPCNVMTPFDDFRNFGEILRPTRM